MSHRTTTMLTYVAIGAAATLAISRSPRVSVQSVSGSGSVHEMHLMGIVRDFQDGHADFDVMPSPGLGAYAGNVERMLGSDGRPIFNAGGDFNGPFDSRVAHWKFDEGAGGTVADDLGTNHGTLNGDPQWTGGNVGGALHFDGTNDYVEIPSSPAMQITGAVTFAGWFKLDHDFDSDSAATMVVMEKFLDTEHDFHIALAGTDYNRSEVPKGALVFKVENGPTSDYYCYTWTNRTDWEDDVWYHFAAALHSGDTAQNTIFINGVDDTSSTKAVGLGFIDTGFDAPMHIGGRTIDYNGLATDIYFEGTIDDVAIFDRALSGSDFTHRAGGYQVVSSWSDSAANPIAPHLYQTTDATGFGGGSTVDTCGDALADSIGSKGGDSDGGVSSGATFDQWVRDVPGVNLSTLHAITLTDDGSGVYEYIDNDFYPVDDRLYGNDGAHNHHFTFTFSAAFTYSACASQFLEFEGGDAVWVYVDNGLVLDLSGVGASELQHVDFDRLELVDGETYSLRFFHAQRQSVSSVFRLRTNLNLAANGTMTISSNFD